MTVSYQYEVASSTGGGFTKLLFKWKGSLYKLIYRELALFLILFDITSLVYRRALNDDQKRIFEHVVMYCDTFINLIPLSFVLGFYVTYIATRWWQQYMAIPWPDKIMHNLALYIPGNDEKARILKRTLMRYLNLTLVLILRSISSAVKKRFPTMEHLVEVGFLTQAELQTFQSVKNVEFNTYWIPCTWFVHQLRCLKEENNTLDSQGLKLIMEQFNEFRSKCGLLWSYDWISIPLVYTQVVTLATYSFFIGALFGRQYVENVNKVQMEVDIYFPIVTILQFFFYMGLLKVAEQLINPFGDDEEDFELNWLIDRHTKVSYLGVDTLMLHCPPLVKDKYFDDDENLVLPYTGASFAYKKKTFRGSVHYLYVPEEQRNMYLPEIIEEGMESDDFKKPKSRRSSSCRSDSSTATHFNVVEKKRSGSSPSSPGICRGNSRSSESDRNPVEKSTFSASSGKNSTHNQINYFDGKSNSAETSENNFNADINRFTETNQKSEEPNNNRKPISNLSSTERSNISNVSNTTNNIDTVIDVSIELESSPVTKKVLTKHDSFLKKKKIVFKRPSYSDILRGNRPSLTNDLNAQELRNSLEKHGFYLSTSRESINQQNQWKGIRWKPYVSDRQQEHTSGCCVGDYPTDSSKYCCSDRGKLLVDACSYVNEGFVTPETSECLPEQRIKQSTGTTYENNRTNGDNDSIKVGPRHSHSITHYEANKNDIQSSSSIAIGSEMTHISSTAL